jgi:hypothetical protein
LSGIEKVVPIGAVVQVFDIPVPIVAHALTAAPNHTIVKVDDTAPMFNLPIGGGGLPINKMPNLRGVLAKSHSRSDLPPVKAPGVSNVSVAGIGSGTGPQLPNLHVVPNFGGSTVDGVTLPHLPLGSQGSALPTVPVGKDALPVALPVALPGQSRADLPVNSPSMTDVSVAGLGSGTGPQVPAVNVVPNLTGTNIDGVSVPNLGTPGSSVPNVNKVADGSALSSLDATQVLPTLNVLEMLPKPQLG